MRWIAPLLIALTFTLLPARVVAVTVRDVV